MSVARNRDKASAPEGSEPSHKLFHDEFQRRWVDLMPQQGQQTNITFWDRDVLNEIDSDHIKGRHKFQNDWQEFLWKSLVAVEGSPYQQAESIPQEEFLWALNTVASRHLVLDGVPADDDPNALFLLMPLLDLINHSANPNVALRAMQNSSTGESFVIL